MILATGHVRGETARMRSRRTLPALVAAGAIVLAACGGGDDGESGDAALPAADDATGQAADAASADEGPTPVAELLPTQVDLIGTEVLPAAEIDTNLLPPVVLDDVTTGRKVNFRNLVPQDKPVLLWMYAPH